MDRFAALEQRLKEECPGLELRRNEPMSAHTTFRVGGPARLFLLPKSPEKAEKAAAVCRAEGEPLFFLGNGSNLLAADGGYEGVVLATGGMDRVERRGNTVTADCGVPLPRLAAWAAEEGLAGLEFASGIPGTVGGAVTMNAGAYGGELAQVVQTVEYLDETGERRRFSGTECGFSYRHSIFSNHPEWLVLSAELALEPGEKAEIRARMAELNARRREKQPLEYPSAGSTFKRPAPKPDGTPVYAAALIDGCGLKGLRVGGAQVSEKHAGFIVNTGGATCADILALMDTVRERVLRERGVELEPEVRLLGV